VYGHLAADATGSEVIERSGHADVPELAEAILAQMPADEYPNFVEFAREHVLQPGYDFGDEFDIGLRMALDGIAGLDGAPSLPGGGRLGGARR